MKILQISYEYPPLGGGAGVICRHTSIGLAKLGHEVTVLSTWFDGENEDEVIDKIRVIRVKSRRKKEFQSNPIEMLDYARKAILYFNSQFAEKKFDLTICHYTLPSGIVGRYISKHYNIPYYIVSHGHDVPFVFPKQMLFFHLATYFWIKTLMKNAKGMFVQSNEMEKATINFMGSKFNNKLYKIPNGCNTDFFYPDYSKRGSKLKIIQVGRVVDQKDPMTYVKAIRLLRDSGADFEAWVIGDGPLLPKIKDFIKENNLESYIFTTGWVSKEEMKNHYQSAHIQVISSIFEAMSIAALEALCSGVFLISTPVSGNREIIDIGTNGNIFNFKDALGAFTNILEYYNSIRTNQINNEIQLNNFRKQYDWSSVTLEYQNKLLVNIPN